MFIWATSLFMGALQTKVLTEARAVSQPPAKAKGNTVMGHIRHLLCPVVDINVSGIGFWMVGMRRPHDRLWSPSLVHRPIKTASPQFPNASDVLAVCRSCARHSRLSST
jgi:hypothetical protein